MSASVLAWKQYVAIGVAVDHHFLMSLRGIGAALGRRDDVDGHAGQHETRGTCNMSEAITHM